MVRGLFITLEGGEGAGKSTQAERLAARLQAVGREAVLTREPGGTPLGEQVRALLKFAAEGRGMCPETELLLFNAARAQHVRQLILPALEAGRTVLCDRFDDSTLAYQGAARALRAEDVRAMNAFATGGLRPDLTLYFDLDPREGFQRALRRPRPVGEGPDRMEQESIGFYEKIRECYLEIARQEPGRVKVVDAAAAPDAVEQAVWALVEPLTR